MSNKQELPGYTNEAITSALAIICAAATEAMKIASEQSGEKKTATQFKVSYGGIDMTVTAQLDPPESP